MSRLHRILAIALISAGLAACRPSRGAIFEWVPVDEPIAASGSGAAGAGAGGRGGQAGVEPDAGAAGSGMMGQSGTRAPLDQNVEFNWTETLPGPGSCRGGWYVGGFACSVENVLVARLEGTFEIELVGPSESRQLEVSSGVAFLFDGTGAVSFSTAVTGRGDCASRNFAGEIPLTTFSEGEPGLPGVLLVGLVCGPSDSVKGTLTGRLDPDGLAIDGRVSIMIGTCTCNGDFDLRATR